MPVERIQMRRGRAFGLVIGTILILSGLFGFAVVADYWSHSMCSATSFYCSPHSALNQSNATTIVVGSVTSTGVLVLGGVVAFVAGYFPYPDQTGIDSSISRHRKSDPGPSGFAQTAEVPADRAVDPPEKSA